MVVLKRQFRGHSIKRLFSKRGGPFWLHSLWDTEASMLRPTRNEPPRAKNCKKHSNENTPTFPRET